MILSHFSALHRDEDTRRRELKGRLMGRVNKSQANAIMSQIQAILKKSKKLLDVFNIKFLSIFLRDQIDRLRSARNKN